MIRCLLVDDQDLVRTGMSMVVGFQPDMQVVGELSDGDGVVAFCREHEVDVILMDIRMKRVGGLEAIRQLADAEDLASRPKVIALTTFDLDEYAVEAIASGASGFLLKDSRAEDLTSAIRSVVEGDAVLAPSTTRRLLPRLLGRPGGSAAGAHGPAGGHSGLTAEEEARIDMLSPREEEVFSLVADGLNNQEIAAALFVSEATVKTHINRILAKLGARDRIRLVVLGQQRRQSPL